MKNIIASSSVIAPVTGLFILLYSFYKLKKNINIEKIKVLNKLQQNKQKRKISNQILSKTPHKIYVNQLPFEKINIDKKNTDYPNFILMTYETRLYDYIVAIQIINQLFTLRKTNIYFIHSTKKIPNTILNLIINNKNINLIYNSPNVSLTNKMISNIKNNENVFVFICDNNYGSFVEKVLNNTICNLFYISNNTNHIDYRKRTTRTGYFLNLFFSKINTKLIIYEFNYKNNLSIVKNLKHPEHLKLIYNDF